jgi:hypothetical protein
VDFNKSCALGETRRRPDGFAFAMDCKRSKTIITFRFLKDLVAQAIQNLILAQMSASSSILTMMSRVGDCPGQPRRARKHNGPRTVSPGEPHGEESRSRAASRTMGRAAILRDASLSRRPQDEASRRAPERVPQAITAKPLREDQGLLRS